MKIVLLLSNLACVFFGYGSYQLFTILGCWNRCESLFESPKSLAVFGPIIVAPLLCSIASSFFYLQKGTVKLYLLLIVMVGGAVALHHAGMRLFAYSSSGVSFNSFALTFLIAVTGVLMMLPLLYYVVSFRLKN